MSDFLVVGGGSAGIVLTRRLLDAGKTVTLVEAGLRDPNPDIDHLYNLGKLWHSEQDWDYYTVPQKGAHGRRLHLPRGKVLGGSHALNACIWVRGDSADYDAWEEMGNSGWGWSDVLPFFKKIENFDGGASATRGGDGPLDVRENFRRNPLQESMVEAAQQAGHTLNPDYNSGDVEGISRMQLNLRDGERFNVWHAYLRPVADHKNLTLITDARVEKVLFDANRAKGVLLHQEGKPQEVLADTVILSAGALGSPEILLRSGVGPRAELEQLGIKIVADIPGVGKNLHDHLLAPVIFTANRPIPASEDAPAEVHLFAKSSPAQAVPDTQPIFFSVPMYSQDYGQGQMEGPAEAFTLMAGIVRPVSRGELKLTGASLADPVTLDLAALSDDEDIDALVASIKHCREIGNQQALAGEWGAQEIWPGTSVHSDEELEAYARDAVVTYHHQVGTCAMGKGPESVVDSSNLAVHGVESLHVIDASVMPVIPTGNTNAPTIMIAEKVVETLVG